MEDNCCLAGLQWTKLIFNGKGVASNLLELVINPVLSLADHTLDADSIVGGILNPFKSISDEIADSYRSHLYGHATLLLCKIFLPTIKVLVL